VVRKNWPGIGKRIPEEGLLTVNDITRCTFGVLENPAMNGAIIAVDGSLWV